MGRGKTKFKKSETEEVQSMPAGSKCEVMIQQNSSPSHKGSTNVRLKLLQEKNPQ